jgi:hypothetical protein
MIDLEHAHALDPGQPVRARVEACAEQHELVEPARERGGDRVVDPARAHAHRRARPGPARVDRARERGGREQGGQPIAPAQERRAHGREQWRGRRTHRGTARVLGGVAGAVGEHPSLKRTDVLYIAPAGSSSRASSPRETNHPAQRSPTSPRWRAAGCERQPSCAGSAASSAGMFASIRAIKAARVRHGRCRRRRTAVRR